MMKFNPPSSSSDPPLFQLPSEQSPPPPSAAPIMEQQSTDKPTTPSKQPCDKIRPPKIKGVHYSNILYVATTLGSEPPVGASQISPQASTMEVDADVRGESGGSSSQDADEEEMQQLIDH